MDFSREMICDLAPDEQNKIRAEISDAYKYFGYEGKRLDRAINRAMDAALVDVCNLLGTYKWFLDNEERNGAI